jgi:hypothetical protein
MKQVAGKSIVLCAALLVTSTCLAWGHEGHRLTGLVAEKYLTPKAKERLETLLPGMSLPDAATWMDEQRPALLQFARPRRSGISMIFPSAASPRSPTTARMGTARRKRRKNI